MWNILDACNYGEDPARITSYLESRCIRRAGSWYYHEVFHRRIANSREVCFGTGSRAGTVKGKTGVWIWISAWSKQKTPTSSTLFSNNEGPPLNKDKWCTFCNGPHPSTKCAVVADPEARKKILRQKGRCFGCLRSGHLSRDCEARCYRCGGNHHVSLCNVQEYPGYSSPARQARGSNKEQTVSANLYLTQDIKNNCVLLQTARASVRNPN